jgi:uncharacterized protein YggE
MLAILALISARAVAQNPVPAPAQMLPPEIATSADAEVVLAPTRALVHLDIETRAATAAAASNEAGRKVRAVRQAVSGLGFPLDSVRTVSFTVSPTYDFQRGQKPVDYRGLASIELTVRNLDRLAPVMDTALATGVTQVPDVMLDSDSVPVARSRALGVALQRAKTDAEALARAAGGRLGRLLSATTSGNPYPMPMEKVSFAAQRGGGAPEINRNVTVRVSVQARWEFQAP